MLVSKNLIERPGLQTIIETFDGLPEQPKVAIARRLAALGLVSVPDVYDSLQDSGDNGEPFIARTEHPGELLYSGLPESITVDSPDRRARIAVLDAVLRDPERDFDTFLQNRQLPNRSGYMEAERWRVQASGKRFGREGATDFARQHSLSFWQFQAGANLYMVADSGRAGRYYVGRINRETGVAIIEDGRVQEQFAQCSTANHPTVDADKLVEYYEKIRRAPLFDDQNCPIIELIDPGDDETPSFLQYHPTQQQRLADFEVSDPSDDIFFVRGATPEEGVELTLWTSRFDHHDHRRQPGDTAIPFGFGPVLNSLGVVEYYLPPAELYVEHNGKPHSSAADRERFLLATTDHGFRSRAFKPGVTIGMSEAAYQRVARSTNRTHTRSLTCHLIADGNRARVEYFDDQTGGLTTL